MLSVFISSQCKDLREIPLRREATEPRVPLRPELLLAKQRIDMHWVRLSQEEEYGMQILCLRHLRIISRGGLDIWDGLHPVEWTSSAIG